MSRPLDASNPLGWHGGCAPCWHAVGHIFENGVSLGADFYVSVVVAQWGDGSGSALAGNAG